MAREDRQEEFLKEQGKQKWMNVTMRKKLLCSEDDVFTLSKGPYFIDRCPSDRG